MTIMIVMRNDNEGYGNDDDGDENDDNTPWW